MLYSNPSLEMPESDTIIWRYLDFTKFVSLLDKSSLYFSRSDTLEDPFEGSYTKANLNNRKNKIADDLIEFSKEIDPSTDTQKLLETYTLSRKLEQQLIYVNCWHMNQYESAAMWKSYLKSDEGVAIKSSIGRLGLGLEETKDIVFAGKVKYIDYENEVVPEENKYLPFLHKRKSFEYENEVRAVLRLPGHTIIDSALTLYPDIEIPNMMKAEDVMWTEDRLGQSGVFVRINLDILIEKVYISPAAEDWFFDLVKSVSKKYGLNKETVRSSLADKNPLF